MKLTELINEFWKVAERPSDKDEGVYDFVVIAIGHIWCGALLGLLGLYAPVLVWFIPVVYFLVKEVPDILRGGSIMDSIVDCFFIGVGVAYNFILFPANLLIATGLVLMVTWAKYSRKAA